MKNNVFKSVMSLVVLGIFILIAVGYTDYNLTSEYLGNGLYSETITSKEDKDYKNVTIGKKNELGFWEGEVNITKSFEGEIYKETVNFVDGERHGKSHVVFPSGEYYNCYNHGVLISYPDDDDMSNVNRNTSGYDILSEKYPWFVYLHLSNGK